ncbi:hypothetical protein [Deinococcus misasensis]|uniref:hypothetical protein n=1 Tax=Deinococcus misasensis TaxID=392413 RepID=UPI000554F695|nr:hypothetical protein [Deinococcus misasensis]
MAGVSNKTITKTKPVWAGDFLSREHVLPGGVRLDATSFVAGPDGKKRAVAGTPVGKKNNETTWGPAADDDDQVRLLAFDSPDIDANADGDLYRPGGLVYTDKLPVTPSAAVLTKLKATYDCTTGGGY